MMSLQMSASPAGVHSDNTKTRGVDDDKLRFKWEKLPLEVYETLVQYLDGTSFVNLCLSSAYIKERLLEPFAIKSFSKRQIRWHKFCMRYFDTAYVCKIVSSFEENNESHEPDIVCSVAWEDVFKAYMSYWSAIVNGNARNQRLDVLENKLKAEILCMEEAMDPHIRSLDKTNNYSWITIRSGGGKAMLNVMLPCPSQDFNYINMVTVDVSDTIQCKHMSSLCKNSASFLGVKLIHFPLERKKNDIRFIQVDRVILAACNQCITTTPLLGGVTRRMPWMDEESSDPFNFITQCPVFEVHHNVIALWLLPKSLVLFLMIASPDQKGYEFCFLYRIICDEMENIWSTLLKNPSHYLPIVIEYKGDANSTLMSERAKVMLMGGSQYLYHPREPICYGVALISPFHVIKVLRPSTERTTSNKIENMKQLYSLKNSQRYLHHFKEPGCSGRGHGLYVFCSTETIAMSWDGITWIFGHLDCHSITGSSDGKNMITHVEITTHNNDLLLVVNEDIILVKVEVQEKRSGQLVNKEKMDLSLDLELKIKPMRLFQTSLASLGKIIAHMELNFDNGNPFFLVIAKNQADKLKIADRESKVKNELSICIMRIYFQE